MSTQQSFADVSEGVRATIAAYAQALDDGRAEDVVATFSVDGTVEIPGIGTHQGHDALLAAFTKWTPRIPQRHVVVNTHVSDWNDHEANAVSDLLFLLRLDGSWSVQMVGRYHDTFRNENGKWQILHRTAKFID